MESGTVGEGGLLYLPHRTTGGLNDGGTFPGTKQASGPGWPGLVFLCTVGTEDRLGFLEPWS